MGCSARLHAAARTRRRVRGSDAIDRIEILRNGRVIATHCHQGTWDHARETRGALQAARSKRAGGRASARCPMPNRHWEGQLSVSGRAHCGLGAVLDHARPGRPATGRRHGDALRWSAARNTWAAPARARRSSSSRPIPTPNCVCDSTGWKPATPCAPSPTRSRVLWYRDDCIDLRARDHGRRAGERQARRRLLPDGEQGQAAPRHPGSRVHGDVRNRGRRTRRPRDALPRPRRAAQRAARLVKPDLGAGKINNLTETVIRATAKNHRSTQTRSSATSG